jgi:hypothetical protein
MALREFRMSDVQAKFHDWRDLPNGQQTCARCQVLALVRADTYYLQYPADPSLDCERNAPAMEQPNKDCKPSAHRLPMVQAEFQGVRITFPNGCHPTYLASVVLALRSEHVHQP